MRSGWCGGAPRIAVSSSSTATMCSPRRFRCTSIARHSACTRSAPPASGRDGHPPQTLHQAVPDRPAPAMQQVPLQTGMYLRPRRGFSIASSRIQVDLIGRPTGPGRGSAAPGGVACSGAVPPPGRHAVRTRPSPSSPARSPGAAAQTVGGAQNSPLATSLRIWMSSCWSATRRFSRAFSFSRSFSRRTASRSTAPYSARQRCPTMDMK